nr:immunoglobulin light chain junction region [Macaca mulatta]MOV92395.1 immunoglobulin light chain junction region [Macaca mulatta]MOV93198.1 immunoglobulin light chain junction region [Macaca mulatta]MOV93236.1 immunoglobulin light chain junction region [Macaca mulatta]MOV93585.1 immunoglobulin light chain junction region [Macaca mulatta]
CQHYDSFPFTF